MITRYPYILAAALWVSLAWAGVVSAAEPAAGDFFASQVRPILEAHCFKCHGDEPAKLKGGLWLRSRAGVLRGGELGKVVDLESPASSLLLKAIGYEDDHLQMPPRGKLPAEQIAILTRWVERGVPWAGEEVEPPAELLAAPEPRSDGRDWWAYQPIRRPPVPQVRDESWVHNPIDAFVLAKLEAAGLKPAPPADRVALIRRVYFDLIGLPPTPAEVEAFVNDTSPNAYEKLIDRLLLSPHYGERWGRHWLDLVRYAETNGYERDGAKPHVWRYRDYVVQSFNEDKPYDQFIREQIAGDDLTPLTDEGIIATGYYRLGIWDDEPADAEQSRFDELDDILATTSQVFLGMTINCARCHDHKVDPILQKDYYRLLAFFRDVRGYGEGPAKALGRAASAEHTLTDLAALRRSPQDKQRLQELAAERRAALEQKVAFEDTVIKRMGAEDQRASENARTRPKVVEKLDAFFTGSEKHQYTALTEKIAQLEAALDVPRDMALSVNNAPRQPEPTHVLIRGNPHAPGPVVEPGFPTVLGFDDPQIPAPSESARSSGRRRVLADWIASPENPLTARVMVNRVWHYHFGRGLVRSTSEFGGLGDKPTHPQLLDWLATRFVEGGRRLKAMHKLIMMSSTYRMSSADDQAALAKDPGNDLLWRFDMRRLSAEEVRDSVLAVNGSLNRQLGGPSIYTEVPAAVLATASMPQHAWGESPPEQRTRRSIYIFIKRSLIEPVLGTFDLADTDSSCPVRFATTVPTQALTMLNSEFFNKQAEIFAQRLVKEAGDRPADQVRLALQLALSREPRAAEIERGVALLRDWQEHDGLAPEKALEYLCLMVLNLNEFVYLD
jgi:hypothetical protein